MYKILLVTDRSSSYIEEYLNEFSFDYFIAKEEEFIKKSFPIIVFFHTALSIILKYRKATLSSRNIIITEESFSIQDTIDISPSFISKIVNIDQFYNALIKVKQDFFALKNSFIGSDEDEIHHSRIKKKVNIDRLILSNKLTKNEQIFLEIFAKKEKVYSEEELLIAFSKKNSLVTVKTLKNLVSNLRKKIDTIDITNIYGGSYSVNFKGVIENFDIQLWDLFSTELDTINSFNTLKKYIVNFMFKSYSCDRSVIIHIDKDEGYQRLLYQVTKDEYSVAFPGMPNIVLEEQHTTLIDNAIENKEPYIVYTEPLEGMFDEIPEVWNSFIKPKSIIFFPIKIRDKIYSIGMHQCSYKRVWQDEEVLFLKHMVMKFKEKMLTL